MMLGFRRYVNEIFARMRYCAG